VEPGGAGAPPVVRPQPGLSWVLLDLNAHQATASANRSNPTKAAFVVVRATRGRARRSTLPLTPRAPSASTSQSGWRRVASGVVAPLETRNMDSYLLSLGLWNFAGSILMIGFFYQSFGRKMLNDWTKIFNTEFVLDYWGKFWLTWSIGLGIFFGLVNIYAAKLNYVEVKEFLIWFDVVAYIFLLGLSLSQIKAKRTGSGIYMVLLVFAFWIAWGVWALQHL
jgi:hypothetical protein